MDVRNFADKGVALDRIITDRWKLKDAAEVYAKFDMQQMGKGMLLPGCVQVFGLHISLDPHDKNRCRPCNVRPSTRRRTREAAH